MKETIYKTEITSEHRSMIKMLLYFDIFQYPLNRSELALATKGDAGESLNELIEMGIIEQHNEWFFLSGRNYKKRISEKTDSPYFYQKAKKYSRIINNFPFVRGVYISGSLSKNWSDDTTDVDYFIVTTPQRLWLCRTMLILFKKIFLFNSRKYFCLNYFIDTSNLSIEEKNIFTATEICFLKPVVNKELYNDFLKNNSWISEYYSETARYDADLLIDDKNRNLKIFFENVLSGKIGEMLDIWSMKRTLKYWRNKFPEMENKDFNINFKSNRTISKHHPSGFQKKVLEALETRIRDFESDTQISLK